VQSATTTNTTSSQTEPTSYHTCVYTPMFIYN
jgi:hypothetical protein